MSFEWLSQLKDIVVSVSAVSASLIAYNGLHTWRRELRGKSEYELARKVLRSVFKVGEGFKIVRNPAIFAYEFPEEYIGEFGAPSADQRAEATLKVYEKRFNTLDIAFRELEELFIEALVQWGSKNQNMILELRKLRSELIVSVQNLIQEYRVTGSTDWMSAEDKIRQLVILYFSGGASDNCFTQQINDAISKFDIWLRPYIKK